MHSQVNHPISLYLIDDEGNHDSRHIAAGEMNIKIEDRFKNSPWIKSHINLGRLTVSHDAYEEPEEEKAEEPEREPGLIERVFGGHE